MSKQEPLHIGFRQSFLKQRCCPIIHLQMIQYAPQMANIYRCGSMDGTQLSVQLNMLNNFRLLFHMLIMNIASLSITCKVLYTSLTPQLQNLILSLCLLKICAVKALPEINPMFDGVEVDERILKYYYNNHVRQFVYDRPTYRGPADKDNEFKVRKFSPVIILCRFMYVP